ncbi:hypothetical protein [Dysosmobacter welbionis]|jgi:hypothetical protein|uniref:hypothetical protein n=1 Tax=Dysosmobacter welbionis TaxID=2093857 RepID=UPI0011AEAD03
MENDSKTTSADNWGQIIRKDARGCFVEIKNDCFHLEKVHLQFVSYDTSLPKGSRYTSNINIYIDVPEFLALTQEAASGTLHMRMQQYKQEKKQEPLYEHLGGTSAKQLAKYGKPRSDGKSLSRVVKLTISSKSDYFLTADSGPGEENKTGLIVPKFGANPEQHVSVILSWRQLNELLLTTAEHYRAWLSAKYTAEWGAIHGPRINEREKKSSGRSKAQAPPQPAQDSASRKPPEQPVPPAQPPQSVQPARQVGFASVFGSIYGSGTGKSGAGDRRMF